MDLWIGRHRIRPPLSDNWVGRRASDGFVAGSRARNMPSVPETRVADVTRTAASRRDPQSGEECTPVSYTHLNRMNWTWRVRDGASPQRGPAVVFDIDGVLSDAAGRQHFIERGQRNWASFFEACGDDPVIEEVARLLELLDASLAVILLTGRPQRVQPQTLAWLKRYGLRWDCLLYTSRCV